jgi:hypothetical protein
MATCPHSLEDRMVGVDADGIVREECSFCGGAWVGPAISPEAAAEVRRLAAWDLEVRRALAGLPPDPEHPWRRP